MGDKRDGNSGPACVKGRPAPHFCSCGRVKAGAHRHCMPAHLGSSCSAAWSYHLPREALHDPLPGLPVTNCAPPSPPAASVTSAFPGATLGKTEHSPPERRDNGVTRHLRYKTRQIFQSGFHFCKGLKILLTERLCSLGGGPMDTHVTPHPASCLILEMKVKPWQDHSNVTKFQF